MSLTDAALSDLNDATNEVAAELDALEALVAESDSSAAARIHKAADRLRGLAADPEAPVPPAEPEVPAEPETPVDVPVPAEDQPVLDGQDVEEGQAPGDPAPRENG